MGCSGSVSVNNLKPLPEDNEGFFELCKEYNDFCRSAKGITKELLRISESIDKALSEFFSVAPNDHDLSQVIIVGYIKFILCVVHYLCKTKRVSEPLSFSNYLPGIILDTSSFCETSNPNETLIRRKYEVLAEISELLPMFIDDFDRLSEQMIEIVIKLRDEYPKRFYDRSLQLPGFSCVIPFSQIEMILIHNIEVVSKPAVEFEKIFKNIRVLVKKLGEVIEKCHERFADFKKMLNGVDTWDYSVPNNEITKRILAFIGELEIDMDSSRIRSK